jgi:ATPase subunit of ABC transporter with duplicated ATPase domains
VRHAKVAEAHRKTFSWIFEDASQGPSGEFKFQDWLLFQEGIYWIMGKAGSGKSTLMKYLYHHQRTKEALKSWASLKKLVVAKFFFWNAGASMQKS